MCDWMDEQINQTKLRVLRIIHKNCKLRNVTIQQCNCISLQLFRICHFQWRLVQMKWTLVPALRFIVCFWFCRIPPPYYGSIWLHPKFSYLVHRGPPLASVLFTAFFRACFNTIISLLRSTHWLFFRFSTKILYVSSRACYSPANLTF